MKKLNILTNTLVLGLFLILFYSCHTNNNNNDNHDGHDHSSSDEHDHSTHDHNQEHDHETQAYTLIKNGYELFMEAEQFIVNESSDLTIHITRLEDYRPIQAHNISIFLKNSKNINKSAHSHGSGIYHTSLKSNESGRFNFEVHFVDKQTKRKFIIENLEINKDHSGLNNNNNEHNDDLITYLKEQAWKEDFGIMEVKKAPFSRVIKTSGKIMPAPGDETIITALHSGTISLNNKLIEGKKVKKGEAISSISSDLVHQNLTNDYLEAKNKYEKAKLDYERAKKLVDEKLISQKEYLELKLDFESAKNYFNNISKFYSDGNENVKAPIDGFIRTVFVSEGQFIEEGQPIATIIQNKRVILRADISQQYNHLASGFYNANFSPVYTDKLFSIKELNGERISYSSVLPENSFFTSVNFAFDANEEIMPGSYAEVYLKSATLKNCISIPITSLMEDQGNYFIFIMREGESYEKKYIEIGNSDGRNIEVVSGLDEGDYIVSKGTYQVHLASLGNAAPAHTHSH